MGIKILNTEIFDNSHKDSDGNIQPSEISVGVTIMFDDKIYTLDFQTTTTNDYGAYSSHLESYKENTDHQGLEIAVGDEYEFERLLAEIKFESSAEKIWSDYMNEHYNLDDSHFGGMDANSEVNTAAAK